MSASHTPGPWHVQPSSNQHAGFVLVKPVPGQVVAQVDHQDSGVHHANARLIAAAPDLLEALVGVVLVADRATKEFDAAHAAIAKAKGRKG